VPVPRSAVVPHDLTNAPFRATDAIAAGALTRSQLRGGDWRRLLRGVYAHAALPVDHLTMCQAAALVIEGRGVLSGRSAALVHGVDVLPPDAPVEVTVPTQLRNRAGLAVVRSPLVRADAMRWTGLPVTSPVRTAFDLARRLPRAEAVVGVDALCHAGLLSPAEVAAYARARPGWPGIAPLPGVLSLVDPGAESPMETRTRLVLIDGGLPRPVTQHVVVDDGGRFVARLDLAYAGRRLGIEYDGDHHRDRAAFRRDLRRQNALRACGWTVLRFTAADIYGNPDAVVATVRAALRS
jgi:hypothetical protein